MIRNDRIAGTALAKRIVAAYIIGWPVSRVTDVEALGLPEDGIAPGTRWEDIPDTWTCPDCGVSKDDFELMGD